MKYHLLDHFHFIFPLILFLIARRQPDLHAQSKSPSQPNLQRRKVHISENKKQKTTKNCFNSYIVNHESSFQIPTFVKQIG